MVHDSSHRFRVVFRVFLIGTKEGVENLAWKRRRECGVDAFVVQYARHWILFSFGVARYRFRNGLDVLETVWKLVIVSNKQVNKWYASVISRESFA